MEKIDDILYNNVLKKYNSSEYQLQFANIKNCNGISSQGHGHEEIQLKQQYRCSLTTCRRIKASLNDTTSRGTKYERPFEPSDTSIDAEYSTKDISSSSSCSPR